MHKIYFHCTFNNLALHYHVKNNVKIKLTAFVAWLTMSAIVKLSKIH